MKRMAFSLTIEAIEKQTKTVTRRPAETWRTLKVGDRLVAVDKVMGLKKGQSPRILGVIRVTDVRVEPLLLITPEDCIREGFPDKTPAQFVWMLADHYGLAIGTAEDMDVRRIEFEYLTGDALIAAMGEIDARAKATRKARERKAIKGWQAEVLSKAGLTTVHLEVHEMPHAPLPNEAVLP